MGVQFQIEEMPDYLAVRLVGATREAREQFEVIAECCACASKNKLLLDFTDTHGEFDLAERFWLGDQAETFMLHNSFSTTREPTEKRLFQIDTS